MLWPACLRTATARRQVGRVPIVPSAPLAAAVAWPAIVIAVAIAVAICLWGLLRRGSVADRARDEATTTDGVDDDIAPPGSSVPPP
jgi:hypothetical protein